MKAAMLKVAIVGCGKIADSHVEQARAVGRAEVVAVCDSEPLMAEQLAARLGVPRFYGDLDQMLEAERPNVVHVATPPHSHLPIVLKCLDAGAHLFVEKPFALSEVDAMTMLAAASTAGRRISVNYLYNFEAPALELSDWLSQGRLGEIIHVESTYGYNLAGDYGAAVLADPGHWVHRLPGRLFHNVLDHVFAKIAPFLPDEESIEIKTFAFRRRPAVGDAVVDGLGDELRFMLRSGRFTASGCVSAFGRPVLHGLRVVGTRDTAELDYAARTIVLAAQQTQPSAIGRLLPAWRQSNAFRRQAWNNLQAFRRAQFHYFQPMRVLLEGFYSAVADDERSDPISPRMITRVAQMIDRVVADLNGQAGST
jgi:predicted dehydrogenase